MEPAPGVLLQLAGTCNQQLHIQSLDITVRDLKQLIATQQGVREANMIFITVVYHASTCYYSHLTPCAEAQGCKALRHS